jgi:hypothetical protein
MSNVAYKQYSPEEERAYNEAITKLQEALMQGMPFEDACKIVAVADKELRSYILDDALKIMIADLHFHKAMSLDDVAKRLRLPIHQVAVARMEMLEDAGTTAAEMYRQGSEGGKTGNA